MLNRGKIDALPAGYLAAEWLGTDTAQAYITVPLGAKAGQTIYIETEHWSRIYTNAKEGYPGNGMNKKLFIGQWSNGFLVVYPGYDAFGKFTLQTWVKHAALCSPTKKIIYSLDGQKEFDINANFDVPTYTLFNSMDNAAGWTGKKRTWKAWLDGKLAFDLVPAIAPDGQTCMYNKVTKEAYNNIGTEAFVVGMTCKQALKLAELPAGGGELTVSLPWEAQFDYGVYDALQAAKSNGWTITVQYRDPEPDNAVYNKYAQCVAVADMQAVNADYKNDLTPTGEWLYPLPKLTNALNAFKLSNLRFFNVPELPEVTNLGDTFNASKLERIKLSVPKSAGLTGTFYNAKSLTWAEVQLKNQYPTQLVGSFRECTALTHVRINLEHMNSSGWLFENCQLDKESTLHILTQLRTFTSGTHEISIGIHVDNQNDEEVLAAIAEAEAKMWTLSVQWTGTATAQVATYGLRRPSIYAKVSEYEGEQHLDWGHYVTDWEARGYQEFASVEEAKEHFNIGD